MPARRSNRRASIRPSATATPRMIDWLVEAFGFTVHANYKDESGGVAHAQLAFGSAMIMLGSARDDAFGGWSAAPARPAARSTYVAVDDPDALFERVVEGRRDESRKA